MISPDLKARIFLKEMTARIIWSRGDYRKTVIVAGTGRSGTTWLGNIINYNNRYRNIFEPFRPEKVGIISHFNNRQYLRPNNADSRYSVPIKDILSGRVYSGWSDQYNRKIFSRRRLIKDIRINLLLKWIKVNFPEIPIIIIMRNPCAVAVSKLGLGWGCHLEDFLSQPDLVTDWLSDFMPVIRKIKWRGSSFEKYILQWCIENFIPRQQFADNEILFVFYENLVSDPEKEIKNIFSFLRIAYVDSVLEEFKRPSPSVNKNSAIIAGRSLTAHWRTAISDKEIKQAHRILSEFALDKVYDLYKDF